MSLVPNVRVENMTSPRSGREVANQYIIYADGKEVFQSYASVIAIKDGGKVYLTDKWDYSRTTSKYLNQFLNVSGKREVEKKIASGEYELV